MLGADAVMDAVQPRLQLREDKMANRQKFLGHLWTALIPALSVLTR